MAYRETSLTLARRAKQHDSLLAAAESIVREGGFAALSVQALADRMGTGISSIYRHYKGKDELAAAIFRANSAREVCAVRLAIAAEGSIEQRIAKGIEAFVYRALQLPVLTWAMIAEPVAPAVEIARLEYREAFASVFSGPISAGVSSGALPEQNADLAAVALVGAMAEVLVNPLVKNLSNRQITGHVIQFCLGGVLARRYHEHSTSQHVI